MLMLGKNYGDVASKKVLSWRPVGCGSKGKPTTLGRLAIIASQLW